MLNLKKIFFIVFCAVTVLSTPLWAQVIGPSGTNTNGSSSNAIVTAVPFLTISPDSRSGAMGDAGVALTADVNANYWNPAKLAFLDDGHEVSLSYSPWLRRLVPNVNLGYLAYAHKLDDRNTIGASLRYFNLGDIQFIDADQNDQGSYRPSEFSFDISLARKFGDSFSLGLTTRYIHSNLFNGAAISGSQTKAANALAADVSLFTKSGTQIFGKDALLAFGIDISDIGTKIGYSETDIKRFLPTNLRIGAASTWFANESEFTLTFDINKLLVPTPPIRDNGENIISGKNDDVSVPAGIFQSFADAPGGFTEELKEIAFSPGLEYIYNKQFALRAGYFYENPSKGNRQYLTLGAGFKFNDFQLDFSYLAANQQNSPLANTLRFTLSASFGKPNGKEAKF